MSAYQDIVIKAGPKALAKIQKEGLHPQQIKHVIGSAGGPKALALTGLDRFVFGDWLSAHPQKRCLLGSSIAAWRFLCALQASPSRAFEQLADTYIATEFDSKATQQDIERAFRDMLLSMTGDAAHQHSLLNHPYFHLAVVVAKSKRWMSSDNPWLLAGALFSVFAGNYVTAKTIDVFFDRVLVHDPRLEGLLPRGGNQNISYAPLNTENLVETLMATASIPFVMPSIKSAPHWPEGVYRDGGFVDYNFCRVPFETEGIILFPHFSRRIAASWFDKTLSEARAKKRALYTEDIVMIAPSAHFEHSLSNKKIPDRGDYKRYSNAERKKHWLNANQASYRLAEQFEKALSSGDIMHIVQPL